MLLRWWHNKGVVGLNYSPKPLFLLRLPPPPPPIIIIEPTTTHFIVFPLLFIDARDIRELIFFLLSRLASPIDCGRCICIAQRLISSRQIKKRVVIPTPICHMTFLVSAPFLLLLLDHHGRCLPSF